MSILQLSSVTMSYGRGQYALDGVSCAVDPGAMCLLMGPSGAGKSTLLKLVLAMERPQVGTICVAGRDIHRLRRASIPYLRRNVGVVFQDFKLLPDATPLENVELALAVLGLSAREITRKASAALRSVELDPAIRRGSRSLSGGEQQRIAIARALAGEPALLLADEPTGNLDPRLTCEILDLLTQVRAGGTTVLLATHDPLVREHVEATQELHLEDGQLVYDSATRDSVTASGEIVIERELMEAVA